MNGKVGIFYLVILAFSMAAFAANPWTNEPVGSTPIVDYAFNSIDKGSLRPGVMWGNYGSGQITADPTAPYSPSNVMVSTLAAGASTGGSEVHYLMSQAYRELFVGLWWRTNPEFQGRPVGNKMFFVRGPNSNGLFLFSKSALANGTGPMVFCHNSGTLDNSHTCAEQLGLGCYPNVGSGLLSVGTWTKMEAYIKTSSTETSRDGIARWWINGALAGNYTNLNYASAGLNDWLWAETWDGCGISGAPPCDLSRVNTVEWDHYIDHVYISAPNCGSNGCPAPAYLVITSSLSPARTGAPYTATLTADGGTKPYTWFLQSGSLPAGLSLSSSGVISGSPTCVGRSDFTIRVTDASQPAITATKSYTIIVSGTSTYCPSTSITGTGTSMGQSQFIVKAVDGKVTFNLPVTSSAQYRLGVYDLAGKKIYEHVSMGQREISIAKALKGGVYVAKFVQGAQASAVRFSVMN